MSKVLAGLLSLAVVFAVAAPASAQISLGFSVPASSDTLPSPPAEVTLIFNEKIGDLLSGMEVLDKAGTRFDIGPPQIANFAARLPLKPITEPGEYTVKYRIGSVESQFVFFYAPPAGAVGGPPADPLAGAAPVHPTNPAAPAPAQAPTPSGQAPTTTPPEPTGGPPPGDGNPQEAAPISSTGLWIARFVNYVSITIIVGLLLAGTFLLKDEKEQRQSFELVGEMAIVWALSAIMVFVMALTVAATLGLPEALQGGLPQRFAGTRLGKAALIQAGLALALAVVASRVGRGSKVGRETSVLITGAALFTPALWGHAGTSNQVVLAVASDWVHLVAVTSWVGGLAILALFVLRPDSTMDVAATSARFSKVAGISVVVVLVTGTINSLMRINSPGLLFSTQWGRLVLIKLGLFGVIALLGLRNRSKMLKAIAADPQSGRETFRKMAGIELLVMLLSFAAATALASTNPPGAEEAARSKSIDAAFGATGQIR